MPAMYVEHVGRPSFFSRLDVRTKLFIGFLVSTLIFVWSNVFFQAALFLVVLLLVFSAHIDMQQIRGLFMVMIPFMIIVLLIHGLWNDVGRTALVGVPPSVPLIGGWLTFYWEGAVFGLMVIFRMLATLFVLPLVVMTTDVNDLVVGLVRMRVPYKVAFIFSIALRYVPFIFGEINAITEAQRLRGLAIEKMNVFRRIPVYASLAVPLILGSLLKAQMLEVVLQSKAFSGDPRRTFLTEVRMRPVDYLVVGGGLCLLIGAIVLRLTRGVGAFVA
jgi:energy-coupling factor transport system permease protein